MPKLVELQKPYRPLLPPSAIQFLGEIVQPDMRVFEFGAGESTLWFAEQECDITSVEHSIGWADYIRKLAQDDNLNIDLREQDRKKFPDSISYYEDESFDLVFVDCWSRIRNQCVKAAMSKVKVGGWLLLDDTQWAMLSPSVQWMFKWKNSRDFYGIVDRKADKITKCDVSGLYPQAKVEITRCTFWQKP
jgi:predicted O-methyltransferase YrrM